MKPIIAFCGAAGAGKDSVAKRLEAKGVRRHGFAFPLKRLCSILFGWDFAKLDELEYKEATSGHRDKTFTPQEVRLVAKDQWPTDDDLPAGRTREECVAHLFSIFAAIQPEWTRRRILQWVGTEGFRHLDPNHWTKKAIADVDTLLQHPDIAGVALTDLRFLNEADELRKAFPERAWVIRVERTDGPAGTQLSGHASEQEWQSIPVDHVFRAAFGELPKLYERMEQAWTRICEQTE